MSMLRGAACFLVLALLPATAAAQISRSYWGVSGGFIPDWKVPSSFEFFFDADEVDVSGSEFHIGVVRGRMAGGDWGVSFVRKRLSDGLRVGRNIGSECAFCGTFLTTTDTKLNGVEVHKFVPFGTIKDRVQIGMNFSGGVGTLKGTVNQQVIGLNGTTNETVEAKTLFMPGGTEFDVMPLGKVELAVAGILGPDLKIRVSGGFNMPGYSKFHLTVVYLIGAR
jgi:hypothetical protein